VAIAIKVIINDGAYEVGPIAERDEKKY